MLSSSCASGLKPTRSGSRQTAAVETPSQLTQQHLGHVVLQAARPAGLLTDHQTVVGLALHEGFALQVVGQLQRTEQHRHPTAGLRQHLAALLQLVEVCRRRGDAPRQGQQPGQAHDSDQAWNTH